MAYGPSFVSGYVLSSELKCDVSLMERCVKQESPSDFFDSSLHLGLQSCRCNVL